MKKIIYSLVFALACTSMFSCEEEDTTPTIPAESISINESEVTLMEEATVQLTGTVLPEEATDKVIKWSSSDIEIAKIDGKGLVTAVKTGEATISAITINKLVETCKIIVTPKIINITSITITNTTTELEIGKTLQINTVTIPSDATNKTITYTSSDETIATVNEEGLVTAIKEGNVKITATSADGGFTASHDLTIIASTI